MRLLLERLSSGSDSTLGALFVNQQFRCWTLEDEYRAEKVYGETRIPAGTYYLGLRKEGGFHQRYSRRFPDIHRGMLHVLSVPGFEHILIHVGNTHRDTAGCILVGLKAHVNNNGGGSIYKSVDAYRLIYPSIAAALDRGEDVSLNVRDRDRQN